MLRVATTTHWIPAPARLRSLRRPACNLQRERRAPEDDLGPSSDAPLPLPDIAVRADEDRRRIAAGDMWGDCGLVFTTRLGDPLDPRNFHTAFKTRAAKAGVPIIPVHATRRTCASLLVALDVHPRVAMAVLRHSRIAMTMEVYSQVSSQATREALRQLGGRLGGSAG